jgi:3D (Asp-Asp-Asp) domain-containing protein
LRKLPIYAFAILLILNVFIGVGNYDGETGMGVVEEVIVQQLPELTHRERLDDQVSRGKINAMTMEITAYSLKGITKSGVHSGYGIVAVDPDVIPLGSRLYIDGYGEAVAGDTGDDDVTGYRIDIYLDDEDECWNYGRQLRKVYILERGNK